MPTRALSLLSLLTLAIVSGPGCVSHRDNNLLTFLWTFDQGNTCETSGVDHVIVSIPGQTLDDAGVFPCRNGGVQGITLSRFASGTYTYTVTGFDAGGQALYATNGTVTVAGDKQVSVDLSAYGYLSWSFSTPLSVDSPTCSSAFGNSDDISEVQLYVDSSQTPLKRYFCSDGLDTAATAMPGLSPGLHHFLLVAVDASGYEYAYSESDVQVSSSAVVYAFTLAWEVGSVQISWGFRSAPNSCSYWGVTNMSFNFAKPSGGALFEAAGNSIGDGLASTDSGSGSLYACSLPDLYYSAIPAGTYGLEVQATGGSGAGFAQYFNWDPPGIQPPQITVVAGAFGASGSAVEAVLLTPP